MCKIHGQDAIAKKGEIYLPNPSPIDENEAVKKQRYRDYQKRAVYSTPQGEPPTPWQGWSLLNTQPLTYRQN